jgi:hypothetical protein
MLALLRHHFGAVAYRGLTRTAVLKAVRPISGNPYFDFAADTVWMTRLAAAGELVRLPQVLYRKRLHPGSTHRQWFSWSRAQRTAAWTDHCLRMLAEAFAAVPDLASRVTLVDAARDRLAQMGRHIVGVPAPLPDDVSVEFEAAVAAMLTRPARPVAPRP